ncbi:isochorismate synthase, partial [Candidatus Marinamargulisbacteria bacterium SCGC AG-414-C22]
ETTNVQEQPNYSEWTHGVNHVLKRIQANEFEKIVLARKLKFQIPNNFPSYSFFEQLAQNEPNCSLFFIQNDPKNIFFSLTPERLFKKEGNSFEIDIIAGTRPTVSQFSQNQNYTDHLLSSTKDHSEHEYVLKGVFNTLKQLSSDFTIKQKHTIIELAHVKHLKSIISGTLHQNSSEFDLIQKLHPTAAVGGYPQNIAKDTILSIEPFNRGFYAGVGGIISKDYSEFLVLLRSCLIHNDQLHQFSGAGIVEDSTAQLEWDEITAKSNLYTTYIHDKEKVS